MLRKVRRHRRRDRTKGYLQFAVWNFPKIEITTPIKLNLKPFPEVLCLSNIQTFCVTREPIETRFTRNLR